MRVLSCRAMPRRKLVVTPSLPYHLTSRSNNREWFYLPLPEVHAIFREQLVAAAARYPFVLNAAVLMSNHFHLIAQFGETPVDVVMRYLLTETSRRIQKRAGRMNHVFGSRYKWSLLESPHAVAFVYEYVLRNPVRAGLCTRVEDWPYSSARFSAEQPFSIADGVGELWSRVLKRFSERLAWLNAPPRSLEEEALIRKSLRREVFVLSRSNAARESVQSLCESYGVAPVDTRYLLGPKGD